MLPELRSPCSFASTRYIKIGSAAKAVVKTAAREYRGAAELGAFDDAVIRLNARFPRSSRHPASAGPAGAGQGRGMGRGRGAGSWSGGGDKRGGENRFRRADADNGYDRKRREVWMQEREAGRGKEYIRDDASAGSAMRAARGTGSRHTENHSMGGGRDAPEADAWDGQAGMEEVEDLVGPDGLLYT